MALLDDGRRYLINASPDVNRQIERYLRTGRETALRESPLGDIFLTNADLDHSLGLLLLREGAPLRVHAPDGARQALEDGLRMSAVLGAFCGAEWIDAASEWRDLGTVQVRAIPLAGSTAPRFAPAAQGIHVVGWIFRQPATGKQVGIFPDVAELSDNLLAALAECDLIFFDGTFWRDDELAQLGISLRTARNMGHVPISGPQGSLVALSKLRGTCVYLHLNNTNPILDPASSERREVESAGLRVAEDGMIFDL